MTIFATEMEDLNLDIFNLLDHQPSPSRGAMIVAKPTVEDYCFKRSVALLVDHDNEEGSMGVIINKPTRFTLNEVLPDLEIASSVQLFLGGPVGTNQLFFIHSLGDKAIQGSVQVAPGVYFGGDFEMIKMILGSSHDINGKIKFMVGYCGWTAGQLNQEVNRHDWAVLKDRASQLTFSEHDDEIWSKAVALFGEQYRLWSSWPTDVSQN